MKSEHQKKTRAEQRTIFFGAIRLTKKEYDFVEKDFQKSPYRSRSAYMRGKIFDKKISEGHQKRHQAFLEAAKLNSQISKIGNNFNQLVHAINTFKVVEMRPQEQKIIQDLDKKLAAIAQIFEDLDM